MPAVNLDYAHKFLERSFPTFFCSVAFAEISFLFETTESDDGGDDVSNICFGFILRQTDQPNCVLFLRDFDSLVFHGFFSTSVDAHDYACDRYIIELYQSPFLDLSGTVVPVEHLSTESVDN